MGCFISVESLEASKFTRLDEVQAPKSYLNEPSGVLPVTGKEASVSLGGDLATSGTPSSKLLDSAKDVFSVLLS